MNSFENLKFTNIGKSFYNYGSTTLGKYNNSSNSVKIKICLLIIFILFFISWFIYYLIVNSTNKLKKQINCGGCSRFYKNDKYGNSSSMIEHYKVNQIPQGGSSTWCFWININDWYYKYNSWKNVFFKGTKMNPEDELSWDSVSKQCPGIWMTPNQNNLRVVFNTKRLDKENNLKTFLEYCQINDIPIGRWCHISVVLINKTVEIYLNGELVRTCIFKGEPEFNTGPLQVSYSGGFNGNIKNLRYIGKKLESNYIKELYKTGPEEKGRYFWDVYDNILPKIELENVTITLPKISVDSCDN